MGMLQYSEFSPPKKIPLPKQSKNRFEAQMREYQSKQVREKKESAR